MCKGKFLAVAAGLLATVWAGSLTHAHAEEEVAPDTTGPLTLETRPPEPFTLADLAELTPVVRGWREADYLDLARALYEAPSHGLPSLDAAADSLQDPDVPAETRARLASLAYMRFASWLEFGMLDPETLLPRHVTPDEADRLVRRLEAALRPDGRLVDALQASMPRVRDYNTLRAEMLRVLALRPIWPSIERGPVLEVGDSGPRVDQLRARLAAEGLIAPDWRAGEPFNLRLETAVRRYQGRVNLAPTGRLDRATLTQLNTPPDDRIVQLMVNLEQRRWRTRELGYRHIWVNIADFRLEDWEDGRLVREHEVMVGREVSSTPEFSDEMEYLVLNPWWGLPGGSARSRFRAIRRNPGLVSALGYRIFDEAGQAVPVSAIDWDRWGNGWPYRISQAPGPDNPMGEVKFIFPNRHNVYIHDTTERDQFVRTRRDFSAGCIRVQDPLALAEWVLAGQDGWDRNQIDTTVEGDTPTVVWLDRRLPVHIAYWTVVGEAGGSVRYLNDLYGRDGEVMEAFSRAYGRADVPRLAPSGDLAGIGSIWMD